MRHLRVRRPVADGHRGSAPSNLEAECQIYRELWAKLVKVHEAALTLRPIFDPIPVDKTKEEIKKERLEQLNKTFVGFREVVVSHEPFYSPEVSAEVNKLAKVIREEGFDYHSGDSEDREYWKKARENAALIGEYTDKICAAIQERIGSMSPIPE